MAQLGWRWARSARTLLPTLVLSLGAAQAGPVVCTTTLEAPRLPQQGPVQVSRCAAVLTPPELIERRAYTWRPSFAAGVDPLHQATDLLGIALGGADGRRLMGLGFPDQTIIWDGSAVQATSERLLEAQSDPMPSRSTDVPNGFSGSLRSW
ncbi:MAG: hypothetical protein VKN13_08475 [Cyanobacteriota bacterium]|nr:hypothetical protein [Cyanobacteriota bacterium]